MRAKRGCPVAWSAGHPQGGRWDVMGPPSSTEASVPQEGLMGKLSLRSKPPPAGKRASEPWLHSASGNDPDAGAGLPGGEGERHRGERCEENPELSPKVATAGIHYPLGDVFIASVSHGRAPGWEQPRAGAASNSDGVWAARPAPYNGSSQASPPGCHMPGPGLGPDRALFWATSGHVFCLGCFVAHLRSDARALPLPAMNQPQQCPPMPMPLGKASPEQGVLPHDDQKWSCQLSPPLCLAPQCRWGSPPLASPAVGLKHSQAARRSQHCLPGPLPCGERKAKMLILTFFSIWSCMFYSAHHPLSRLAL